MKTCPWCGLPDDCQPGTPGTSRHHDLCCLDRSNPICTRTERTALNRIMREDNEREVE